MCDTRDWNSARQKARTRRGRAFAVFVLIALLTVFVLVLIVRLIDRLHRHLSLVSVTIHDA